VVLRDGRKLIGVLRSYDQFGKSYCSGSSCYVPQDLTTIPANLVLEGTVERKHLAHYYADQAIGVMIIRGENVVLLGEIVSSHISDASQTNASIRTWMSKTKSLCSRSHLRN
jgi:U6 snRNA-associated Sm-like protein LSm1